MWHGSETSPIRSRSRCSSGSAKQVRRAPPPRERFGDVRPLARLRARRRRDIPSHLALWSAQGALVDELVLDSLDLPPSLLVDHGARPARRRQRQGVAGASRARCALRADGPGRAGRGDDRGGGPTLRAGAARPRGPAARSGQPAVAALPAHPQPAGGSLRGHAPPALDARGVVRPERVSAGAAGRATRGARLDRPARAGAALRPRRRWSCCSTPRCSALLWLVAELDRRRAPAAPAVAEPRPVVPYPARGHARRVLPAARHRLRGVELRAPGGGGRAEPRPADHPDPARCRAHGGRRPPRRHPGAGRSAPRAEPANRRGSRALPRRAARGHEHAGPRGPRRHAAADGSRCLRRTRDRRRARGDA